MQEVGCSCPIPHWLLVVDTLSKQKQKIGIFGGTFNPIHWGHLLVAETALDQFELSHVLWVPTFRPSHKSGELMGFEHRLEMVQGAIAHHPAFSVSDIDRQRQSNSYAVGTLLDLEVLYPKSDWHWIIGLDAFQSLPQWYSSAAVAAQCTWLVAPRNIQDTSTICHQVADHFIKQQISFHWKLLNMPQVGISSSLIRDYWQTGRSLRYLVPDSVRHYLTTKLSVSA
ncbi:MAG: nicotinate (nicotinamide) nucleotide adenylyltransferase [Leptolyngbya sp.]|nr:MAG: nicotinate (nicotinamide) nucleotide adenylyltransferase [Leptolyngbya sp.]